MIPRKSHCSVPFFTSLQENTKHNHVANEIAITDSLGKFPTGIVYEQEKEYVDKIYVIGCWDLNAFSLNAKRKG